MREIALAHEQVAAKFRLQHLDGARQRGLRHIAFFGGAGEIENTRDCQEIADLMHFHKQRLLCAPGPKTTMARVPDRLALPTRASLIRG